MQQRSDSINARATPYRESAFYRSARDSAGGNWMLPDDDFDPFGNTRPSAQFR